MIKISTSNYRLKPLTLALMFGCATLTMQQTLASSRKIESLHVSALQQQISGTVTDGQQAVSGATVSIKGTNTATSTDAQGKFSITAKNGDILVVKSLGYESQEILVSGSAVLVHLTIANAQLDEIVVTGYSTQKKGNITASIATISSDKLKDVTTPNVTGMLQGKVSGVEVVSGSGQPGSGSTIRIRGRNSISSGTNPLWVVDGIIMHGTPNINPNDIESMSILKDAAATTQYGSRGTNGVIVVTTKRATKDGESIVTANIKTGTSRFNQGKFKLMNSQEIWDYYKQFKNPQAIPDNVNEDVLKNDYNWLDNGTKTGIINDHSLTYLGKTEKTSIYSGVNYYKESGAVKGYEYQRLAGRLNIDHQISSRLTFKPKINVTYSSTDNKQHSLYDMFLNMPWDKPYDDNGNIINPQNAGVSWYGRDKRNYLYDLQYNYGKSNVFDIQSNLDFSYRISDAFTFESMNSLTFYNNRNMSYTDPKSNGGLSDGGRVYDFADNRITRFFNQMLKYQNTFGRHEVSGFVAYEYSDYKYSSLNAEGKGITPGSEILGNASSPRSIGGTKNDYAFQSGIIQGTYSYDSRYNFQASYRLDGSSRFGSDSRYGGFYSGSAAWNIHNESFFQVKEIDFLRLKASFGMVGNVPSSLYASYDIFKLDGQYNGTPAAYADVLENPKLSWEKSKDTNLGIELGLFNRLTLNADYYYKNTDGLLYFVQFPSTAGYRGYWENIGAIRNQGLELAIGVDVFPNDNPFQWHLDFNISKNNNRIKELKDGLEQPAGNKRYAEGRDIDSWYMRKWAGVDPANGDPLWYRVDKETGEVSTTNSYNNATLQYVGTSTPKYQGGFSSTMRYKSWSLNASFSYVKGAYAYNEGREYFDTDGAYPTYNQIKLINGWSRWTPENTNATHPAPIYNGGNNSNKTSSRYLEDASFLRLRNVTLGYQLPQTFAEKLKLKNLNVFASADNLWISTKFSGLDPEAALFPANVSSTDGDRGNAISQYPAPKRFTFGVNISF